MNEVKQVKRGRPRSKVYSRLGKVLTEYTRLCAELHKQRRILEAIVPHEHESIEKYARGRAHDMFEKRKTWPSSVTSQREVLRSMYHGTGIQCSTCGTTHMDPEFTVEEEKLYPKLRIGRIIWRLPCGHRMDWLMPSTKAFQQIQADRQYEAMGWNLDKSCEESGVPTVRTVRAFSKGLTQEDWNNIIMLRETDQRKREFVELCIRRETKELWSARKKKYKKSEVMKK